MRSLRIAAFVCSILVSNPASSGIFDIGFSADFEGRFLAGLDQPTRELLLQLDDEYRESFLMAIREAKPLLDDSVERAVNNVEKAMARTIDKARCSADGFVDSSSDTFTSILFRLNPFTNPIGLLAELLGLSDGDIQRIENDYDRARGSIGSKDSPGDISIIYAEHLNFVSRMQCKVNRGNLPPALAAFLDQKADRGNADLTLWMLLTNRCSTPLTCLKWRHRQVTELADNSDKRDLGNARDNLANVKILEPGVFDKFTFEIDEYQSGLQTLLDTERSILISKFGREESSRTLEARIRATVKKAKENLNLGNKKYQQFKYPSAKILFNRVLKSKATVDKYANNSFAYSDINKVKIQNLQNVMNQYYKKAREILKNMP